MDTIFDLIARKDAGKWGWVFDPSGITEGYGCIIKECTMPCIFEFFPEMKSNWYSVCAWHGKAIGMHAYYDESAIGVSQE